MDLGGEREEHDERQEHQVQPDERRIDVTQQDRQPVMRHPEPGDHIEAHHEADQGVPLVGQGGEEV
jgi:hypothetical protein